MHPLLNIAGHALPAYVVLLAVAGLVSLGCLGLLERASGSLSRDEFWLLANVIVLSGFVGGRLLSWLAPGPAEAGPPGFDALVSDRGLPTFGVLAGVLAGVWACCRWLGKDARATFDRLFLVAPIGHGLACIGCFLAGCCGGRPVHGFLPWAVVFTDPLSETPRRLLGVPLHPAQLYAAAGDFLIATLLFSLVRPRVERGALPRGAVAAGYFAAYGALRFATEYIRFDAVSLPGTGLTVGQALSLAAVGGAVAFYLAAARERAFKLRCSRPR